MENVKNKRNNCCPWDASGIISIGVKHKLAPGICLTSTFSCKTLSDWPPPYFELYFSLPSETWEIKHFFTSLQWKTYGFPHPLPS